MTHVQVKAPILNTKTVSHDKECEDSMHSEASGSAQSLYEGTDWQNT